MDEVSGVGRGSCVVIGSWPSAKLGLPSVLLHDLSPLLLAELFKCCTLLVNRHNTLKVLQSNIYAARKHFILSLNSHVIYLFLFSDLTVLYQNWRIQPIYPEVNIMMKTLGSSKVDLGKCRSIFC
jgi:hypothetical protein